MAAPTPAKHVKVSLNLLTDEVDFLRKIAARRGTTVTRQFQEAIAMHKYVDGVLKEGSKLLVEDRRGKTHQLIFR